MLRIVNKILLLVWICIEIEKLLAVSIGVKRISVSGCAYGARPGAEGFRTEAWKRFNIGLLPPIVWNLSTTKVDQGPS